MEVNNGVGGRNLKNNLVSGRKLKMRIFCLIPLLVSTLIKGYLDMCGTKVIYEGEPLVNLLKLVLNIAAMVLLINVNLKLDGYISWTWKQISFPFWIIFSIMVVGCLIFLSFLLMALCPILACKSKNYRSLLCHCWINANSIGITALSIILNTTIVSQLDKRGPLTGTMNAFIVLTCFSVAMLIFTLACISPLM